jgi:hypothetical protein
MVKDPAGFIKASHGANTGRRGVTSVNVVKSTSANTNVNNNLYNFPKKKQACNYRPAFNI